MTSWQITVLLVIGLLGHVLALLWYLASKRNLEIVQRRIYDIPINADQLRRELKNSLHAPMHAVILAIFVWFGFFQNATITSFLCSALATTLWAEIWHYISHRAFHLRLLHWIHAEHHRSRVNSPLTAISFSFTEKVVFDFGLLVPLAAVDMIAALNFYGIAAWYIGYLLINSFSHANFELKSQHYNKWIGKVLTTTTYHSLHHSRYTGNYGLGTRILDRIFQTEWDDYEMLYDQICDLKQPLKTLRDKAADFERLRNVR
jgi:sterol desaturase/sphingolipid hydroxylase (fatty acid hydroxylase superfamily)